MKYDLVIFDVDGTLIDTSEGLVNAAVDALNITGYPLIEKRKIIECIGPPLSQTFVKKGYIKEDDLEVFNNTFRALYKDKYLMSAKIYPGVIELLDFLHNKVKLAIATNKREDYTYTLFNNLELTKYFDIIRGTDYEGKLKKTDLINYCIKTLNVRPVKTVLIGDTIHDQKAAEETGINFIGVSYGYGFKSNACFPNDAKKIMDLL